MMYEELLGQLMNSGAVSQISQALGTDEATAGSAVQAALPMLVGALARNAATPDGAESLNVALQRDHDGSVLDNLAGFLGQNDTRDGQAILGHVFGDRLGAVEQGLGQVSGLNASQIGALLALLAPIVLGMLGRTQRNQNLDAGGLSDILGGARQQAEAPDSPLGGLLGSLLDSNRDGQVLDDLARMAGAYFQRRS